MARKPPPRPSLDVSRRQPAPTALTPRDGERLLGARDLPLDQLAPDPDQPRRTMDPAHLTELAASLKEHGVLQPLLVREDGELDDGRTRYRIIAGGRRYAAAQQAGLQHVPVVICETEGAALRLEQLTENLQRENLDPLEEAVALRDLMELSADDQTSTRALGERIGRSHMYIQRRLDLLFDPRITDAVRLGRLNATVAGEIKSLSPALREDVLTRLLVGETFDVPAVRSLKKQARDAPTMPPGDTEGVTQRYTAHVTTREEETVSEPVYVAITREEPVSGPVRAFVVHQDPADPRPVHVVMVGQESAGDARTIDESPAPATPSASIASALRALVGKVEADDLGAYTDAQKAQDAGYSPADDSYRAGFLAALKALRRVIGP